MGEHGALHFGVQPLAPAIGGEEGPADLDCAALVFCLDLTVACVADDAPVALAEHRERTAGGQSLVEKGIVDFAPPAVVDGVLLPHCGVGGDLEERLAILLGQRAQDEPLGLQRGLPVERHRAQPRVTSPRAAMNFSVLPACNPATLMRPEPAM